MANIGDIKSIRYNNFEYISNKLEGTLVMTSNLVSVVSTITNTLFFNGADHYNKNRSFVRKST